ncbi:hypothetical protein ACS0TY_017356 [Phlomoides rotata]
MDEGGSLDTGTDVLDLGDGLNLRAVRSEVRPVALVGRLCSAKSINLFAMMEVMNKGFRPKGRLSSREWGNGMVLFSFELPEDREWVLRNQPWHFDGALFVIKPLNGTEQPSTRISTASLWTRVYDLPLAYHSERVLRLIAAKVGVLECFESLDECDLLGCLRFKVEVDITRPLMKGIQIRVAGEMLWLPLKYESLPFYCYCCGVVGHFFKECKFYDRDETLNPEELSYGPSLKAPPLRRNKGAKPQVIYVHGENSLGNHVVVRTPAVRGVEATTSLTDLHSRTQVSISSLSNSSLPSSPFVNPHSQPTPPPVNHQSQSHRLYNHLSTLIVPIFMLLTNLPIRPSAYLFI